MRFARIDQARGGNTLVDRPDRLGTSLMQTSGLAAGQSTRTYDAFGILTASTGTPQGPFGFAGSYGYQEDKDTGLKLLGHRYYDPSTGRFLTRDPIKDGRNWYAYCGGNPLKGVDPTGLIWFLGIKLSAAAIIGVNIDIGFNLGEGPPQFHFDASITAGGQIGLGAGLSGQYTSGAARPQPGWKLVRPFEQTGISIIPLDVTFTKPGENPTVGLTFPQLGAGVATSVVGTNYDR